MKAGQGLKCLIHHGGWVPAAFGVTTIRVYYLSHILNWSSRQRTSWPAVCCCEKRSKPADRSETVRFLPSVFHQIRFQTSFSRHRPPPTLKTDTHQLPTIEALREMRTDDPLSALLLPFLSLRQWGAAVPPFSFFRSSFGFGSPSARLYRWHGDDQLPSMSPPHQAPLTSV